MPTRFKIHVDGQWQGGSFATPEQAEAVAKTLRKNPKQQIDVLPKGGITTHEAPRDEPPSDDDALRVFTREALHQTREVAGAVAESAIHEIREVGRSAVHEIREVAKSVNEAPPEQPPNEPSPEPPPPEAPPEPSPPEAPPEQSRKSRK